MDAVLIPGGGLSDAGDVVPWAKERLDRAIALQPQPSYFIPLSAGTTHKPPPLDADGFPILESIAAAQYMVEQGIRTHQIWPETVSLDTIGNAYFARLQHTDPLQLYRLHVITSAFHLPRVEAIFNWVFHLPDGDSPYTLTFEAVANTGLSDASLWARCQKDQTSLAKVKNLQSDLTSLLQLHQWLYSSHDAYTVSYRPARLTGASLATY